MTPKQRQLRDWLQELADEGGELHSPPVPRIEQAWEALRQAGLVTVGRYEPLAHNPEIFRRTVKITERGRAALDALHADIEVAADTMAVLEEQNYSTDEMGEPQPEENGGR